MYKYTKNHICGQCVSILQHPYILWNIIIIIDAVIVRLCLRVFLTQIIGTCSKYRCEGWSKYRCVRKTGSWLGNQTPQKQCNDNIVGTFTD